jgi:hypothetical protein
MKIELSVEGGFARLPGLAKPVTIDSATLPRGRGAALATLVAKARFFDAAPPPPPAGARDARAYTIAIDDGARRRALCIAEPIADASMRELVDAIVACAGDARRGEA